VLIVLGFRFSQELLWRVPVNERRTKIQLYRDHIAVHCCINWGWSQWWYTTSTWTIVSCLIPPSWPRNPGVRLVHKGNNRGGAPPLQCEHEGWVLSEQTVEARHSLPEGTEEIPLQGQVSHFCLEQYSSTRDHIKRVILSLLTSCLQMPWEWFSLSVLSVQISLLWECTVFLKRAIFSHKSISHLWQKA
jgi:hypothetical protein